MTHRKRIKQFYTLKIKPEELDYIYELLAYDFDFLKPFLTIHMVGQPKYYLSLDLTMLGGTTKEAYLDRWRRFKGRIQYRRRKNKEVL